MQKFVIYTKRPDRDKWEVHSLEMTEHDVKVTCAFLETTQPNLSVKVLPYNKNIVLK